jgi:TatD DNase family protein
LAAFAIDCGGECWSARSSRGFAIGECGLDFNRDFSARPAQERVFEAQIHIASELSKPLFLHERDAHSRFVEVLAANKPGPVRGVVHCFTGNRDQLRAYLDMGLYIGITGWIADERRGGDLKGIARFVPSDRLMLETDAPFLLPSSLRRSAGKGRNEPAFIREVLRAVAAARNEDERTVASASTAAAREFFGLTTPGRGSQVRGSTA